MPDWLSFHTPVLVNTVGHCMAAAIFAVLLWFLGLNYRRAGEGRSRLPLLAAGLALAWNLASLVALAARPEGLAGWIVGGGFCALSLLPAVLLQIALGNRQRTVCRLGYVLGALAAGLHLADVATQNVRYHDAGVWVITLGFAGLTLWVVAVELRRHNPAAGRRLAGAMALFLFAISFLHFGPQQGALPWSQEIALHHAGLPLALFVLLQDYRFLLLDAFVRVLVQAALAGSALLAAVWLARTVDFERLLASPFDTGLLLVGGCLLLTLFAWLHQRLQRLVAHQLFLRQGAAEVRTALAELGRSACGEEEYLRRTLAILAAGLHATESALQREAAPLAGAPAAAAAWLEPGGPPFPGWVQAVLPLRFARGDAAYLLFGRRQGGRRYWSEDVALLVRTGPALLEYLEPLRHLAMQESVARAELQALQAQINPHFLFNSLNALYGTITRENRDARRMVLRLAEMFRALLRSERTVVEMAEEVGLVEAYLEIEAMRLGGKLRTEIEVAPGALRAALPLLCIQPLVENAIRHGVAAHDGPGFVRLSVLRADDAVTVEVANSGTCDPRTLAEGHGIGFENVRRRLALCFGQASQLEVHSAAGVTSVRFLFPYRLVTA